jgi:hypothetical protein
MIAAEAVYNLEKGIVPVVFGRDKKVVSKAAPKATPKRSFVRCAFVSLLLPAVLAVHFMGVFKTPVSGRVLSSDGVMACDMYFCSSNGHRSFCVTDAAGRFSTKLYAGTYRVVIEKRPGLPKAYQSILTTPLRVKAGEDLTLKVVN